MAFKIIWSPESIADLESIAAYISRDSETYAAMMIGRIVDRVELLSIFPRSGPRLWRIAEGEIRRVVVDNYLVVYEVASEAINIAAIVHGARSLRKALRGRFK